ncbi:tyrosine-type recombinase/integrase [Amorphus sp. MBR-141]
MTSEKIDELVEFLQAEYSNTLATVNRKMAVLSKAMVFAKKLGTVDAKPEIPFFKEYEKVVRFLTEEEVQRMVKTARSWGDDDLADLIIVGVDTGARYSEIQKSPWSWFTPKLNRWTIWLQKANQPRTIPLTKRVQEILERRKGNGEAGPFYRYDYTSIRRRFNRLCQTLKIEGVTIHVLRHTRASWFVQEGHDLRRVQVWMGHKAIATTLRYAHLAPEHLEEMIASDYADVVLEMDDAEGA